MTESEADSISEKALIFREKRLKSRYFVPVFLLNPNQVPNTTDQLKKSMKKSHALLGKASSRQLTETVAHTKRSTIFSANSRKFQSRALTFLPGAAIIVLPSRTGRLISNITKYLFTVEKAEQTAKLLLAKIYI